MLNSTSPAFPRTITALLFPQPLHFRGCKLSCPGLVHFRCANNFRSSGLSGYCDLVKPTKEVDNLLVARSGSTNSYEATNCVLELAKQASSRVKVLHTDFLTPTLLKNSLLALEKFDDIRCGAEGGYPQAERCRLFFGPPHLLATSPNIVSGLSVTGNFRFQPCSHGDFLAAILGTGIAREKVGDVILQGEAGAQVLVVPEFVELFVSSLKKVGNVPVSCATVPLHALKYEPPRTLSFNTIEASMRVDALASAGFKISRTKIVDLIRSGDVCVNWIAVKKSARTLNTGDVISLNGKGSLKVGDIKTTKKGRYAVELVRFL